MIKTIKIKTASVLFAGIFTTTAALADAAWPNGPVTLVVPYNPGGTTDNMVRVIASMMEKNLGSPVVVTNTAGGGGVVGMSAALESKPDGQTVGMYLSNTLVSMATGAAPFSQGDIVPACMFSDTALTITGNGGDSSPKSLAELEKISHPSLAIERGTLSDFAGLLVNKESNTKFQLVNVGGGPKKNAAVMGGHVNALITPTAGVMKQQEAGQLRVLAVLSDKRLASAPNIPTAKEQGLNVSMAQSNGFMFPKGTPETAINSFCSALQTVTSDPDFIKKMNILNVDVNFMRGAEYVSYMNGLAKTINDLAKENGYAN